MPDEAMLSTNSLILGMGNSKSKSTQDAKGLDVLTDGANIDEDNANGIAVADNDENNCKIGSGTIDGANIDKDNANIAPATPTNMTRGVVFNNTKEAVCLSEDKTNLTDEERENINARRQSTYRKKSDMLIPDEKLTPLTIAANPTSYGVTSFSHDDAELSLSTTLHHDENVPPLTISGVVVKNTNNKRRVPPIVRKFFLTDEQREQINARRRVSYQKEKDMLIPDEKLTPHTMTIISTGYSVASLSPNDSALSLSITGKHDENVPPLTISANPSLMKTGIVLNKFKGTMQIPPVGRKNILTDEQREQINARRRASYRKKRDMLIPTEKLTAHTQTNAGRDHLMLFGKGNGKYLEY